MTESEPFIKPTTDKYDDDVLFGPRLEANRLLEFIKSKNDSECVIYGIGTYADKKQWNIKNLIENDRRIQSMMDNMVISHALPLQRYAWPKINNSSFPLICISPESTGKTYTYLLYIVSKCISETPLSETDELISNCKQLSSLRICDDITATDSNPFATTTKPNKPTDELMDAIKNKQIDFNTIDFDAFGKEPVENVKDETKTDGETNKMNDMWCVGNNNLNNLDPEIFISHPKYIVICSSQNLVEKVCHNVDIMKRSAYGDKISEATRRNLPPTIRSISIQHDEAKLALKCNDSEILVATPAALIKCLKLNYLNFAKCKKVFFDDLDLALQLQNFNIREIVKFYLIQYQPDSNSPSSSQELCQIYLFSRKWTDLVKQFLGTVFLQRVIIFGSISEASVYANVRFELELYTDPTSKLIKLANLIGVLSDNQRDKIAIVCRTNDEAQKISNRLNEVGYKNTLLDEDHDVITNKVCLNGSNNLKPMIYVLSDGTLELEAENLNNIIHLVHYSMPDDMVLFDQRFRLTYKNIREGEKSMTSTIFVGPKFNHRHAKELYDLLSRSSTTQHSTKLQLRDHISNTSNTICWRWATAGLCRLEKLSREDRLGSYCPDKHSINLKNGTPQEDSRWPTTGQLKITITHVISPSEFYFWFEAHRDINSKKWSKLESTGCEFMRGLQKQLNQCKHAQVRSVPLSKMRKGRIFGVYFQQDARVDRVLLLDEPKQEKSIVEAIRRSGVGSKLSRVNEELEYSKQVPVLKIDYGSRVEVFVKNIVELPESLSSIEAQAHRGFHLGFKPTHGEPNWPYKAKKHFFDSVAVDNVHNITVWLRLNCDNCFWFEHLSVTRKLPNIDCDKLVSKQPHRELFFDQLAEGIRSEPSCLQPSVRQKTLSKWNIDQLAALAQYAFLRRDKDLLGLFVLHVDSDLDVIVRQTDYNKLLIDLEDDIAQDWQKGELKPLTYFAVGVYCIAKVLEGQDPATNNPIYAFNRAKISSIVKGEVDLESTDNQETLKFTAQCLDHGDEFEVKKDDLYQAKAEHIWRLPFQAVRAKLARIDPRIFEDRSLRAKTRELIYNYTRDEKDNLRILVCKFSKDNNDLDLSVPLDNEYTSLATLLNNNIE